MPYNILHAVLHALKETAIILPILFLSYLLVEFIEHKAGDGVTGFVASAGKAGPLLGAVVGLIPQCGFSGAAASLFSVGTITVGTLIAAFLSTSDEMLPILVSAAVPAKEIILILLIKFSSAVIFGFLIDLIFKRNGSESIECMCEIEKCCCKHDGIFLSAIKHTVKIILIVFTVTCVLNVGFEIVGTDNIKGVFISVPILGEIVSGMIGLIPNCSSSVLLTDLYVQNVITVGQLISGLCVNAGVGLIVLFRANRNLRENLCITGILYLVGVISGIIVSFVL